MKRRIIIILALIFLCYCSGDEASKHIQKGDEYLSKDDYEMAIKEYTKAIELKPNYHYIYMMRCEAYYKQKRFKLAIQDCSKAIELKSDNTTSYVNRGRSYAAIGEYDLAIKDINKAMELNPSLSDTFKRLIIQIKGWKKEAEEEKQQQKEAKPITVF
jgi:tetratricopeptide (TPR) repeat protein